jgi:hypothetical protein
LRDRTRPTDRRIKDEHQGTTEGVPPRTTSAYGKRLWRSSRFVKHRRQEEN